MSADTTADRELTVTRLIDAPRTLVFTAWTEPEQVARWWGPKGFVTTYSEMDIRPGGAYRLCMRSPEGKDHWKRGVYQEIVPPERIVFHLRMGRRRRPARPRIADHRHVRGGRRENQADLASAPVRNGR